LGGVHGDRVAVGDVFADVVAVEDGQGVVVQAVGSDAVVLGVDGGDAPAVAVAYWDILRSRVFRVTRYPVGSCIKLVIRMLCLATKASANRFGPRPVRRS
jgi:hypothetical protein